MILNSFLYDYQRAKNNSNNDNNNHDNRYGNNLRTINISATTTTTELTLIS